MAASSPQREALPTNLSKKGDEVKEEGVGKR